MNIKSRKMPGSDEMEVHTVQFLVPSYNVWGRAYKQHEKVPTLYTECDLRLQQTAIQVLRENCI